MVDPFLVFEYPIMTMTILYCDLLGSNHEGAGSDSLEVCKVATMTYYIICGRFSESPQQTALL